MNAKLMRGLHLIALCLFVGSIPSHIILGQLAQFAEDGDAFAVYHKAKFVLTSGLTVSGIALTLLTGLLFASSKRHLFKARWFRAKLALVFLIVINGAVILTPLAEQMKDLAVIAAQTGVLSSDFHIAESREAIAGAINIALILIVFYLVIFKPTFKTGTLETKYG